MQLRTSQMDPEEVSNSQYELQSGEFALKPENSPPKAGCFRAGFQNENCCEEVRLL